MWLRVRSDTIVWADWRSQGAMAIASLAIGDVPRHAAATKKALASSAKGIPIALAKYANHFVGAHGQEDDTTPAPDGAWPVVLPEAHSTWLCPTYC